MRYALRTAAEDKMVFWHLRLYLEAGIQPATAAAPTASVGVVTEVQAQPKIPVTGEEKDCCRLETLHTVHSTDIQNGKTVPCQFLFSQTPSKIKSKYIAKSLMHT